MGGQTLRRKREERAMRLAKKDCHDASYLSTNVFDGVRRMAPATGARYTMRLRKMMAARRVKNKRRELAPA